MCEDIYIGNTQQTFKKIMDVQFSNLLGLPKKGQKSISFAAHFGQQFKCTKSHKNVCKYIMFKVVK